MACKCGAPLPSGFTICTDCLTAGIRASLPPQKPYIKQNRFGGDLIEYGAISALFDDIPASEVGAMSGAQGAFDAARVFIKELMANQCRLAGCDTGAKLERRIEPVEHTDQCWFGIRRNYYRDRAAKA